MNWTPADVDKAAKRPQKPPTCSAASAAPVSPVAGVASRTSQEITFNTVVPGNNGSTGLLRSHWTRRRKLLTQYEYVVDAARLQPVAGPLRLELVRYSVGPDMDYDNLVSTGKLLIDALVRCGVLPDDKPAVIAERDYRQVRAEGRGYQRTVIRLIPL